MKTALIKLQSINDINKLFFAALNAKGDVIIIDALGEQHDAKDARSLINININQPFKLKYSKDKQIEQLIEDYLIF